MSTTVRSVPGTTRTNGHADRGPQDISLGSRLAPDVSLRQAALIAGLALLLMTFLTPFANFGVLHTLIVPGDAHTTAQNIAAGQGLFRIGIAFFFVTAILTGQLPGYVFTTSTLSTLAQFEQGMLNLGLLAVGIGVLCFEISFLYDPEALIPWILFAVLGLGASVVGLFLVYMVSVGLAGTTVFGQPGWPEFLPSANWPTPGQPYLFHPLLSMRSSRNLRAPTSGGLRFRLPSRASVVCEVP